MSPNVSIIIPTFNRSALLGQALKSCLEQTYKDFEVLVVDDGSTDETEAVVSSFKDSRIIYLPQSNQGRSKARNRALAEAKGKYITFLDSDDLYMPEKLAVQVKALEENPDFGAVYSAALNIDIEGNLHPFVYEAPACGWIYMDIALYLPLTICLPTVMARREVFEAVGTFDEKLNRFEDTDMWRRIAKKYQFFAVQKPLCKIRYHSDNEMENPAKVLAALKYYSSKVLREDENEYGDSVREKAAQLFCHYGRSTRNHANARYNRLSHLFFRRALYIAPQWFNRSIYVDFVDRGNATTVFKSIGLKNNGELLLARARRRFKTWYGAKKHNTLLRAMNTKRRILGQPLAGQEQERITVTSGR